MENLSNINREMANALRALAVADHGPMADRIDVVTALAKLGIKCQPLGGALFIGNRDTLALADYIDRPSGNADEQNSQPFYRAWRAWCCNYMTYKLEDPIVLIM